MKETHSHSVHCPFVFLNQQPEQLLLAGDNLGGYYLILIVSMEDCAP
jgi:hypothetical protein